MATASNLKRNKDPTENDPQVKISNNNRGIGLTIHIIPTQFQGFALWVRPSKEVFW